MALRGVTFTGGQASVAQRVAQTPVLITTFLYDSFFSFLELPESGYESRGSKEFRGGGGGGPVRCPPPAGGGGGTCLLVYLTV